MAVERTSIEPRRVGTRETAPLRPASPPKQAPNEQRRWVGLLGLEVAVLAACLAVLFVSGSDWFVLPALLAVPIAGSLTVV